MHDLRRLLAGGGGGSGATLADGQHGVLVAGRALLVDDDHAVAAVAALLALRVVDAQVHRRVEAGRAGIPAFTRSKAGGVNTAQEPMANPFVMR